MGNFFSIFGLLFSSAILAQTSWVEAGHAELLGSYIEEFANLLSGQTVSKSQKTTYAEIEFNLSDEYYESGIIGYLSNPEAKSFIVNKSTWLIQLTKKSSKETEIKIVLKSIELSDVSLNPISSGRMEQELKDFIQIKRDNEYTPSINTAESITPIITTHATPAISLEQLCQKLNQKDKNLDQIVENYVSENEDLPYLRQSYNYENQEFIYENVYITSYTPENKKYLCLAYLYQSICTQNQLQNTLKYFQKSAELGNVEAMMNLADYYKVGDIEGNENTQANAEKEKYWLQQAANNNLLEAIQLLASKYSP